MKSVTRTNKRSRSEVSKRVNVNPKLPAPSFEAEENKLFFFKLVKGTVITTPVVPKTGTKKDNVKVSNEILTMPLSVTVPLEKDKITFANLAHFQHIFKTNVIERAKAAGQDVQVIDVVIDNICSLGRMTFDEYNYIPEPMNTVAA